MGIFEDVLLNARSAVDAVGKTAGKVIDISKLKLAAADLKSEITRKYQILGRVAYEEGISGKDYTKNKTELIEKITELKNQLNSVNDLLADASNKKKCASCGAYNSKNAQFCNKCGERLAEDEDDGTLTDDMKDFTEDNFEDDELL